MFKCRVDDLIHQPRSNRYHSDEQEQRQHWLFNIAGRFLLSFRRCHCDCIITDIEHCGKHPADEQAHHGEKQSNVVRQIDGDHVNCNHNDVGANQHIGAGFYSLIFRRELFEEEAPCRHRTATGITCKDQSHKPKRGGGEEERQGRKQANQYSNKHGALCPSSVF